MEENVKRRKRTFIPFSEINVVWLLLLLLLLPLLLLLLLLLFYCACIATVNAKIAWIELKLYINHILKYLGNSD